MGGERLFAISGAHAHVWYKPFKNRRNLVCSIGDCPIIGHLNYDTGLTTYFTARSNFVIKTFL